MPCLIVGNSRTEEMVGELAALTPVQRQAGGCSALRSLWFADEGDVLVLPYQPPADYLSYVTGVTGVDPASLAVLSPPPGELGTELLTPDRLADSDFLNRLRAVVAERAVQRILAVYKDVPLTRLATAVGLAVPGHAFSAQGGDALLNSKASFRALAAGTGAPLAAGLVTARRAEAEQQVNELLAAGQSAMVKQEFRGGGAGNEILSPAPGVRVAGTGQAEVLPDPAAVAAYFARRWDQLTEGGRRRLVVEQYLTNCDTVYAEYLIGNDGPRLSGLGELLMDPVAVGQLVPGLAGTPAVRDALLAAGRQLTSAVHAMGYRGYLSTDAVLTPSGEVFLTETNGRLSGSTHLHAVVEDRLLARGEHGPRLLSERWEYRVPSFAVAVERLAGAGLAFDPDAGTGVLVTSDRLPDGTITCCVVAADLSSARATERRIAALFGAEPADNARSGGRALPAQNTN